MSRTEFFNCFRVCLLILFICSGWAHAATVPQDFVDTRIVSGLSNPTSMAFAPDGRLFVTQQGGDLRVISSNTLLATPFLHVNVDAQGERGLLGVAFDPDFAANRFVYIYYTTTSPAVHNRLSRFTASGNTAVAGSEVVLLELDNLSGATNHNGGAIHFGLDGKLYIAVGNNNSGANSQSLSTLHGKMLRINKDGSIPADNPFHGIGRGEIWNYGLRNPFTFAFNPKSGRMFINDVGENTFEEVNDGLRSANYGWPTSEGPTTNPSFVSPLYTYTHSEGCAITGGTFYDPASPTFPSSLVGKYFFSDFCSGFIRVLNPATGTATGFATGIPAPVDLQVGPDGALYYLARGNSSTSAHVGRITYSLSQVPQISVQPQNQTVSAGQTATFSVTASGPSLQYQWQQNGVDIAGANSPTLTRSNVSLSESGTKFRVRVSNSFGSTLSNEATLTVVSNTAPTAQILTPADGTKYNAGSVLSFSGSGTDPESGDLPASAFTWTIDFHHSTHTHPAMPPTTGIKSGTFNIPNQGEVSDDVFYRIILKVTDSGGLTNTVTRDVFPNKSTLTVATNPAGLQVTLDGQPHTSPFSTVGVVGIQRTIGVSSPQTLTGKSYEFVSWSDSGAINHTVTTASTNTTYTANFREITGAPTGVAIEPDSTRVVSPMTSVSNSDAFGGTYLAPSSGNATNGTNGSVTINVNVSTAASYIVWARVLATNGEADSFFVSVDGGPEDIFDTSPNGFSNSFQWVRVNGRGGGAALTINPRTFNLGVGVHSFQFRGREANAGLDQILVTSDVNFVPPNTHPGACAVGQYKAEYFNNMTFTGTPVLSRCEATINNNWGAASPAAGVNADHFSVRWTGVFNFTGGTYQFTATTDDGMRVFVDNKSVINAFVDQGPTTYRSTTSLTSGQHEVKVEYYENTGGAVAQMSFAPANFTAQFEAEAGSLVAPMTIINQAAASGGQYVAATSGSGTTGSNGSVSFTVNVPTAGAYAVWARVLAVDGFSDSLFVSVDGASEDVFDTSPNGFSTNFQWIRVNGRGGGAAYSINPRIFNLSAGTHTIRFRHREPNSGLDRVILTSDMAFVP
jgi:glucose/arabinose dehydrogenase